VGIVQRNAAGESDDQALAVGNKPERSDALGRIEHLHRRARPVVPIQLPALDVGPPQQLAARISQDAFANDIARAQDVDRLHCGDAVA
jgi:hypothetical protein